MARNVFYSFHYQPDCSRAAQIRNMGSIDGNHPARDNDWESIKRGGDAAIQRWIDGQLKGRSCCLVLIGENTAGRKWINYEIGNSWNNNKGVLGVYVHGLKDLGGYQANIGLNPFDGFTMERDKKRLSSIVKTYNPPYTESRDVYKYIKDNLPDWIEEAIDIREAY
jgi:hypothetical protein